MTVAELIEKLKNVPQDAEVILPHDDYAKRVIVYKEANLVQIKW